MDEQEREVDCNYDWFQRHLAEFLPKHRGEYALLRSCDVIGFYPEVGQALDAAIAAFGSQPFSIQEVTDEPIDLGFFSHVAY